MHKVQPSARRLQGKHKDSRGGHSIPEEVGRIKPTPPADLWQQIANIAQSIGLKQLIDCPPDGFSASMYAKKLNVAPSTASAWIRDMVSAGKLEYVGRGLNNAKFYRINKSRFI